MGVEPTRERLPPPTGVEARPHHRVRLPSLNDGFGLFLLRPIEEYQQSGPGRKLACIAA